MANPYHHAVSSARQFGGVPSDYQPIHDWFDKSKAHRADPVHRALRHHSQGIFDCEEVFGPTVELSTCVKCGVHKDEHPEWEPAKQHPFNPKVIPTRWVGEQHVREDLGRIPTMNEWFDQIPMEPWMNRSRKLSKELEAAEKNDDALLAELISPLHRDDPAEGCEFDGSDHEWLCTTHGVVMIGPEPVTCSVARREAVA